MAYLGAFSDDQQYDPWGPTQVPAGTPPVTTPVAPNGVFSPNVSALVDATRNAYAGRGGGGGYGGGGGNDFPMFNIPGAPKFSYREFTPPDANALYADPSYKARLGAGQDALERSAAAKGVLRTGGSIKDFIDYSQNFAANEYGSAYDRAAKTYGLNFEREKAIFAPTLAQWQMAAQAALRSGELNYMRHTAWDAPERGGGGGGGNTVNDEEPTF